MRPLTSQDPRAVGPYRTLARLGAGGMGVVYLARSSGGALAAVKVIRAEHADDPGFRARFRREAEAAARITGPWVVPVLGADTEDREPWLATAFVPGPSLAEVVGAGGALPTATVRALGSRLAEALVAVHEAGLIHRDVKPGNVLLALDGPRLIDFGIARHEGATALTTTGAVIGTPAIWLPSRRRPARRGRRATCSRSAASSCTRRPGDRRSVRAAGRAPCSARSTRSRTSRAWSPAWSP